jgi:hypothetical protein
MLASHVEGCSLSRLIDAPIQVTLGPDRERGGLMPASFIYRQERHQVVEVMDTWTMWKDRWWEDPGAVGKAPAEVRYWRIRTVKGGVFELMQDGTQWRLYKSYD